MIQRKRLVGGAEERMEFMERFNRKSKGGSSPNQTIPLAAAPWLPSPAASVEFAFIPAHPLLKKCRAQNPLVAVGLVSLRKAGWCGHPDGAVGRRFDAHGRRGLVQ